MRSSNLPDRPLICTPRRLHERAFLDAERRRLARQPGLGLAGVLLVLPVAILLALGAGGAEPSVLVLAPLVTFALPALAMIAFWWEDWPGSSLRPGWSGLVDTVLIAIAAILLAMLGQIIVGRLDLRGIFDPTPGPGHSATFPAAMPLAGAAFVAMLQLTLVCEGWPLRRLGRFAGGIAALVASWAVAIVLYFVAIDFDAPAGSGLADRSGPLAGGDLGALLVLIGVAQVWLFVVWRGWPFAELERRWLRLVSANVVVIGGAWLTYAVVHGLGDVPTATISAAAGSFIAAGLVVGMLFEGSLRPRSPPAQERVATLAGVLLLATGLYLLLRAYADSVNWTRASAEEWVGHVGLNAIGVAVILHVAIGRRWPFGSDAALPQESDAAQSSP
jgi:hypothetical protein